MQRIKTQKSNTPSTDLLAYPKPSWVDIDDGRKKKKRVALYYFWRSSVFVIKALCLLRQAQSNKQTTRQRDGLFSCEGKQPSLTWMFRLRTERGNLKVVVSQLWAMIKVTIQLDDHLHLHGL